VVLRVVLLRSALFKTVLPQRQRRNNVTLLLRRFRNLGLLSGDLRCAKHRLICIIPIRFGRRTRGTVRTGRSLMVTNLIMCEQENVPAR
jgi:hypothetical protein